MALIVPCSIGISDYFSVRLSMTVKLSAMKLLLVPSDPSHAFSLAVESSVYLVSQAICNG